MAGTISTAPGTRWSAAGWLFDWAVTFLSENVTDPALRASLREIVTANLGWLSLDEFGREAESEMRHLLRTRLVPDADLRFPSIMVGRPQALDILRNLSTSV